ncbi:MAG TPA: glycosyltransferase [Thermoanaerobaculia bacterium]|jgi:glycosyltransferase involved in cell wall biosynthesis|nr:glycosyltransferase [Thermoanaerobaculia bacterium]
MPPPVTVIMATYNWSSVLPYSIGSALGQTFPHFELLVVGDGCTDDSEAVVSAIGDPRVRWIGLPVNSGHQSTPNNEGLRQARGELIAYLGHDDLWLPHHLAALVAAIDHGADLAYGLLASIPPDGSPAIPVRFGPEHYGDWLPPTSLIHRRAVTEALGGWGDYRTLGLSPETDLVRRARHAGFRFAFVPRLTAIKLPAAQRRDVYKTRPCHEQATWSERIRKPDFEVVQLASWVADSRWSFRIVYRELARRFLRETARRVILALQRLTRRRGRTPIDELRRFKGL